jgi:hypothetical protein
VLGALPLQHASAAPPPTVAIGNASVTEGGAGTTAVVRFQLTLSAAARKSIGVRFATQDGTAKAAEDYVASNGTVTFHKGTATRRIAITVIGDDVYEGDETFTVHLSHARGASIATSDGTATIGDDDPVPTIRISNASVIEGTGTTTPLAFDVTLTGASTTDVTVDYATADDTASSPGDYVADGNTLTWGAGTAGTQAITIDVVADAADETDEVFDVTLSNVTGGAVIGHGDAIGVILDDDLAPAATPDPSITTLNVISKKHKTLAKGLVSPAHTGLTVNVTLYRKASGHWKLIATKHPVLGTAVDGDHDGTFSSPYKAAFKRLRGRQRIVVQFAGDADHLASSASKKFRRR